MKIMSTLLVTSHLVSEVVLFVEKKTTIIGLTAYKEHEKFLLNLWSDEPWKNKDSLVWYIILGEKIKEGSVHTFNKKKSKQDHSP